MGDFLGAPVLGVYCERGHDPAFWAEPLNAVTNAAFVVAGLIIASRRPREAGVLALALVTIAIGIGSFLFHTLATRGAMIADVAPIQAFIALYFLLAMRRLIGLSPAWSVAATIAFMAFAAALPSLAPPDGPWRGVAGYAGGLLGLIGVGGVLVYRGGRRAGGALLATAALFAVSLTFRTIDGAACGLLPTGTHLVWHLLNALTLYALMAILASAPRARPDHAVT